MEQLTYVVPAGKRTYYFDLQESREQYQYLTITEEASGPNGTVERHRIMVFEEHIPAFLEGINKILGIEPEPPKGKAYDVQTIRKTTPNAYQPWSQEDDNDLLRLSEQGKTVSELMQVFQRNRGAIQSRLNKLKGR